MIRTGIGFDAHQLGKNHKLIIGGVTITSEFGSIGHSDGDALLHAITDAILGAAGLGDIGHFFPSNDDQWKGTDSRKFLRVAVEKVQTEGYTVDNVDSNIILQKPYLQNYIPEMRQIVAETMQLKINQVSVKATTTDEMGFIGSGQGWAAQAIVTLRSD
jgi:2-C-methyl-D-erythritol 2,4-cyclodiphosphate synthase